MTSEMKKINIITSILWAAAVMAAAILHAPAFLTLILLPLLGVTSLVTTNSVARRST
jgi:hypothetical protein